MNGEERDHTNGQADPSSDESGEAGWREGSTVERGREPHADKRSRRTVPTVASWFSGVGGIDLGFEYAGFELVSLSEIETYPSAVLATHWPGVRNLGDITKVLDRIESGDYEREAWMDADVWVGGFPCQDLSIAGPRAGLHDEDGNLTRSGLALAFLRLAATFKPSWIVLENVTGLLNSNGGADLRRLLGEVSKLGYGWAFRVLNSAGFGVPQRRRRVFIVASLGDPSGASASEVLALTESRAGYLEESQPQEQADGPAPVTGVDHAGTLSARYYKSINSTLDDGALVVRETVDASRVRKTTRVPRWMDDPLAGYLDTEEETPFRKVHRAVSSDDAETWSRADVSNTLNAWDIGDRDTHVIVGQDLNPEGYDTNRYKAMGNAVTVPVAYWVGRRLFREVMDERENEGERVAVL